MYKNFVTNSLEYFTIRENELRNSLMILKTN